MAGSTPVTEFGTYLPLKGIAVIGTQKIKAPHRPDLAEHSARISCEYRADLSSISIYANGMQRMMRVGDGLNNPTAHENPRRFAAVMDGLSRHKAVQASLVTASLLIVSAGLRMRQARPDVIPATVTATAQSLPVPVGRAPQLHGIEMGAFSSEAMNRLGLTDQSIKGLDNDRDYGLYRATVRQFYGADLADMNYLGIGVAGWETRLDALDHWIERASRYGAPTLAIEPLGSDSYRVFNDNPEMRKLREVLAKANERGVTVWIRFASECNLRNSPYTVYDSPHRIAKYRRAARWFKEYMPTNAKLVFSPLINTPYIDSDDRNSPQSRTLRGMYEPGVYDRIGGTIYSTHMNIFRAFDWYYRFMRSMDADTPFQICELGGPFTHRDRLRSFVQKVCDGRWPGVEKINLFAGPLNPHATGQNGDFGFVSPSEDRCFITDMFAAAQSPVGQNSASAPNSNPARGS